MMQLVEIIAAKETTRRRRRHRARLRAQHQQDAGAPARRLARLPGQRRARRLHARSRADLPRGHAGRGDRRRRCARRSFRSARSSSATRPASTSPPACSTPSPRPKPLALRAAGLEAARAKRFGIKSGAGIYDYAERQAPGRVAGARGAGARARQPRRRRRRDRRALRHARSTARRASSATARSSPPRRSATSPSSSASASPCISAGPIFYGKQHGWRHREGAASKPPRLCASALRTSRAGTCGREHDSTARWPSSPAAAPASASPARGPSPPRRHR